MEKTKISDISTVSNYIPLAQYQKVKSTRSSQEKDVLIQALLLASLAHDTSNSELSICETDAYVLDKWVSLSSDNPVCSNNDCQNFSRDCIDLYNAAFSKCFPKATGIINMSESLLLYDLLNLGENLKVSAIKQTKNSILEVWVICPDSAPKYDLLKKASHLVNEYIEKYKVDVNLVVIKRKQIIENRAPDFLVSFE